jgi:hypothetical protein
LHNCVNLLKEFRHQQHVVAGKQSPPLQEELHAMHSLSNPESPAINMISSIPPETTTELECSESLPVDAEPIQASISIPAIPSPLVAPEFEPTTTTLAHLPPLDEEKSVTIIAPSSTTTHDTASPMPTSELPSTQQIYKLAQALALSMFPEIFPPKRPRSRKNHQPQPQQKRSFRKSNEEKVHTAAEKQLPDSHPPIIAPKRIEVDTSEPSIVLGAVAIPLLGRRVSTVAVEHAPSEDLVRKLSSRILVRDLHCCCLCVCCSDFMSVPARACELLGPQCRVRAD